MNTKFYRITRIAGSNPTEWRVRFYMDGQFNVDVDYFTDNRQDALMTGEQFISQKENSLESK